jgi:phosphatidylglycerol---prolipoprotein diacylglyceryl transferase
MAPILFKIGPLVVHGYGFMVAVGLLACFPILSSDARRKGLHPLAENLASLYLWLLAAGYVGGKVFYMLTSPAEFQARKAAGGFFSTLGSGFVFYGSLIFCLPTLWWWLKKNRLPVLDSIDTVILAAPVMLGLGRVGCFLAGCCYGCRTSGPLAVSFPPGGLNGVPGVPIHPAQLYETLGCGLVFAWLWFHARKHVTFPGYVTAVYLVLYGVERYVIELFRGDNQRGFLIGAAPPDGDCPGLRLSFSQGVSLVAIAAGVIWLWKARRRPTPTRPGPSRPAAGSRA